MFIEKPISSDMSMTVDGYANAVRSARWPVFIRDHHPGYIDWATFEANQKRLGQNIRPRPHQAGGAVREGSALLQGIAVCGSCGRRLKVHYKGRSSAPGYHCAGKTIVNGRGEYCLNVGGMQIDAPVAAAFLAALTPAAFDTSLAAIEQLDADHESTVAQFRRDLERARYSVQRAERRYRAVDPQNRLVARSLEAEWEKSLQELKEGRSGTRAARACAPAHPDRRTARLDPCTRQRSPACLVGAHHHRSGSQGTAAPDAG
jgi:hypothetical protein